MAAGRRGQQHGHDVQENMATSPAAADRGDRDAGRLIGVRWRRRQTSTSDGTGRILRDVAQVAATVCSRLMAGERAASLPTCSDERGRGPWMRSANHGNPS